MSAGLHVIALIGNPNPGGRTTRVAEAVAGAITAEVDGASVETVELATVAPYLFEWGNEDVKALTERVAGADVIVAACPTYKATFTGLLKAFLDNYGNDGLSGCRAVPVMVGAAPSMPWLPRSTCGRSWSSWVPRCRAGASTCWNRRWTSSTRWWPTGLRPPARFCTDPRSLTVTCPCRSDNGRGRAHRSPRCRYDTANTERCPRHPRPRCLTPGPGPHRCRASAPSPEGGPPVSVAALGDLDLDLGEPITDHVDTGVLQVGQGLGHDVVAEGAVIGLGATKMRTWRTTAAMLSRRSRRLAAMAAS